MSLPWNRAAWDASAAHTVSGGGGGGGSPTFTAGIGAAIQSNGFTAGTLTFSINGGVNFPAGSTVVVFVGQDQNGGPDPTSPKIGGVAMTKATEDTSARAIMYYAGPLASSTGDNFTLTNGNNYDKIGAVGGYLTNVTATPTATAKEDYGSSGNPQTTDTSLTVPSTGFGVVGLWSSTTGGGTPTWNVGTGDISVSRSTTQQILLAHLSASGTPSVTASGGTWGFAAAMAGAAWGP